MGTNSLQSDIFKFVALRPPDTPDQTSRKTGFIEDNRDPEETPVGKVIKAVPSADSQADPLGRLKALVERQLYAEGFLGDDPTLARLTTLLANAPNGARSNSDLIARIEEIVNAPIAQYYRSDETQARIHDTWDRYYVFYLLSRSEPHNLDTLTRDLRLFHVIRLLVDGTDLSAAETLAKALQAMPLVPKLFADVPKPKAPQSEGPPPAPDSVARAYTQLWTDLVASHVAIADVGNLRYEMTTTSETQRVPVPNKATGVSTHTDVGLFKSSFGVSPASFAAVQPATKVLLHTMGVTQQTFELATALSQLQPRAAQAYQALARVQDPEVLKYMPASALALPGVSTIVGQLDAKSVLHLPKRPPANIRASIKPLGIGDLKVVRQILTKYADGEIAHIENVLRGEYKERKHRTLDRTEESLAVTTETTEETTRDTQTTERFELKKESETTLQEQMSVQAGVTVTGSYGAVTFGAHGDFAYSTASSQSNKTASNFAKEVVDRSVARIQKRAKEERVSKKLHEVEELNTHGLDNKGQPDHMVGIYRWVDKYYQAQIYNYGKRMMFEFIVPEPAAFYNYAILNPPKRDIAAPRPFTEKFTDISEHNYMDLVAAYNVQGVTPPPIPWKTVSTAVSKDGMELDGKAHVAGSVELIVPEGYFSSKGVWFDCSAYFNNNPRLEIIIGNKVFRLLDNNNAVGAASNNANRDDIAYAAFTGGNPIQITVNSYDIISYTINAYVWVERNWETYQQWQIQTWEKIASTYQALHDDYLQKTAAQQTRNGVTIEGRNPATNRDTERTELKKHCIKMLLDVNQFGTFDAMKQPDVTTPPDFDLVDAFTEGRIVQFLEQAFEWENMTYLFYPYFWGRSTEWTRQLNTRDPDPLFAKFLQAGSSKVVLPVHPAYNDAVMYFLENNGAVWSGGDTPRLNDPMFVSIAEELRNQTDDLAGATSEGDPWQVVLPTDLVHLQADGELPTFPVNP